ncbi:MAG: prolyl oligopeptidase family serine peptidase [Pseudomonadota bacterium]
MSPTSLSGPERAPRSGTVKRAVIFLHGYGSNGDDLLSIADMMDLPDTQFLSPNAPFAFEIYPDGYQWFGLADRDPQRILREIVIATPILNAYIDQQLARFNLAPENVALLGFSQGSMMAMYAATRRAKPLAGIVAVSGALKDAESLGEQIASRPPICIIHGEMDDVVPFTAMAHAEAALRANNVPVETHARPRLGHGIDEAGIDIAQAFLKKSFGL